MCNLSISFVTAVISFVHLKNFIEVSTYILKTEEVFARISSESKI